MILQPTRTCLCFTFSVEKNSATGIAYEGQNSSAIYDHKGTPSKAPQASEKGDGREDTVQPDMDLNANTDDGTNDSINADVLFDSKLEDLPTPLKTIVLDPRERALPLLQTNAAGDGLCKKKPEVRKTVPSSKRVTSSSDESKSSHPTTIKSSDISDITNDSSNNSFELYRYVTKPVGSQTKKQVVLFIILILLCTLSFCWVKAI